MGPLKPIDLKVLFELMKDSNRSDRQIAKATAVSQPTVTRHRAIIEKTLINGYTAVPKLGKVGFELAALTFIKTRSSSNPEETLQTLREWFKKQASVIFAQEGRGFHSDIACASIHQSYADYAEFSRKLEGDLAGIVKESETFLIDLRSEDAIKPFHFKYLADLKL